MIRVIGRGSYAKVLMVELKKTKRIYAMKVIKKALVTDDEVCIQKREKSKVFYSYFMNTVSNTVLIHNYISLCLVL